MSAVCGALECALITRPKMIRFKLGGGAGACVLAAIVCPFTCGCFFERSFPMLVSDLRPGLSIPPARDAGSVATWLHDAHRQLEVLLPNGRRRAVLTAEMRTASGAAIDVRRHFNLPGALSSVLFNLSGIEQSAQVTRSGPSDDGGANPPSWPGFRDVWIPIEDDVQLCGRLGQAERDGRALYSDCIVLLPGLLGDNWLERTRDVATALRASGLHVLALEPRGFGQTGARYPNAHYTYGVRETGDLLAVADWLQQRSEVRDTGLIGFSWGANVALLVAWEEARADDDPDVPEALRPYLRRPAERPAFRAGVIAFSPVVRFEALLDQLERSWPLLVNPVLNHLQAGVRERWVERRIPGASGDLRELINQEVRRAGLDYPGCLADGYRYLQLLPSSGKPVGRKLERANVPVLIVQAANDPFGSAQGVADLLAWEQSPKLAGIILAGGGHNGFSAYSRAYFYNLVLRFFGAALGPGAHFAHGIPL